MKKSKVNYKIIAPYIVILILTVASIGGYFGGYNKGYAAAKNKTEQEFLSKKVDLVGAYFNSNDDIRLDTFSCTPNDLDGDCSRQILENYKTISAHWLGYCQKTLDEYSQKAISAAKKVNINPTVIVSPFQFPTAYCNDGTASYSDNRAGTCSSHGGVKSWY